MKQVGHSTHSKYWLEILKGSDHSQAPGTDEKKILNGYQENWFEVCGLDSPGSGQEWLGGSWKHGNEPLSSIQSV
jgi:hypothetical protein